MLNHNLKSINKVKDTHREFWQNNDVKLFSSMRFDQFPLRAIIKREKIKGPFSPNEISIEYLLKVYRESFAQRTWSNGDCFEVITVDPVIPWMEAIIGCPVVSLGESASMNPRYLDEPLEDLKAQLSEVLKRQKKNEWLDFLKGLTVELNKEFSEKFLMCHTLLRGPGDMLGALVNQEKLVKLLYKKEKEELLNNMLTLCRDIWVEVVEAQFKRFEPFEGGYANLYGLWAPGKNVRLQEDIASLCSPDIYDDYLFEEHKNIIGKYPYSVFHMHSGYLNLYDWEKLLSKTEIKALEVDLDPQGESVDELMPTLKRISATKPIIVTPLTRQKKQDLLKHVGQLSGSVLVVDATDYNEGFSS